MTIIDDGLQISNAILTVDNVDADCIILCEGKWSFGLYFMVVLYFRLCVGER